ncbi:MULTISPECIES: hypothetical protein [Mesorhizobium]|nr:MULTISPECIES: hypothetical protein [Mesorhizobium]RVC17039.1 hypothetical protein EN884_10460 [Mesorhizobium sp. M7A.F.Ca.AU.001.01.1.1]MDF3208318.1 hypothetical protein [Mesorhizobium sp. LMG15046]MDF3229110.1 hypothetical protein [Mesorhizobium sp. DSM 30133]RUU22219.1 hypothetical protein EOC84_03670 [Mesorhizobium sp. Primo-B]RUU37871.1 hypothetical protein EOC83_16545 [Mesorhizobium sp. Primo-A]
MTDFVRTFRPNGDDGERVPLDQVGLLATPQIEVVSATAYALTKDHHGKILDFTAASAVTLTVPAGLPSDFICGISQGGAGQVTLTASGVTIGEPDDQLSTAAQFVLLTLMAFSADIFRLYGRTA